MSRAELNCTLLGDGSSDRILVHPIRWAVQQLCPNLAIQLLWADFTNLPRPPRALGERISVALHLFPADLLFVHRDAERAPRQERVEEIEAAVRALPAGGRPRCVCVVPVRMTEAWFIFNDAAIRRAAGNPNSRVHLELPGLREVEDLADPKEILQCLLREATELSARRRVRFRAGPAVHRVAELIDSYAPLRSLPAFATFEEDLRMRLAEGGWSAD